MPSFEEIEIGLVDHQLLGRLEPPTPSVDFLFPQPRTHLQACVALPDVIASDDLAAFNSIETLECDIAVGADDVAISADLFEPLRSVQHDGRAYKARASDESEQATLTFANQSASRDREGFRKSFSEDRDRTSTWRRVMTIWEIILPLLEPPISFEFPELFTLPHDLFPYQREGVVFLVENERALLGDDMGTGKTVQTIVAMRILFQKGLVSSALIVVPLSVLKNWDRELLKWAPTLSGVTVVRGPKEQREVQWEKAAHVWVTTYGTIRSDIETITKYRQSFDLVVLDEIQAIKNQNAEQTKAAKRLPRSRSWGLSGTPIENSLDDLHSICEFLNIDFGVNDYLSPESARRLLGPHFLRRRKEDVLPQLPPKRHFEVWLSMEGKQAEAYEKAESEGRVWLESLGEEVTVVHVLELLQRLKQLCNRDAESGLSCKLDLLRDKLHEADSEGSKCLVFSQYKGEGVDFLLAKLKKYNPVCITGSVSGPARDRAVERFQKDELCRLLIGTPKSGGVGITLTAANYVFHFDHWWNPASGVQAEDRAHRIGQTKDVFVYHLWTEGTVEERIYKILQRKQKLYDDVIDSLSNVQGTGLSEDELFGLFDLKSPKRRVQSVDKGTRPESILDRLLRQSPTKFEQSVAKVYEQQGFGTRVSMTSRDGGVDVIASREMLGSGVEKYAIQCKRYAPDCKVGVPEARELLGVLAKDRTFTKGVLVTTSAFTSDCLAFARDQGNLELIDGARLVRIMEQLGIDINLALNPCSPSPHTPQ